MPGVSVCDYRQAEAKKEMNAVLEYAHSEAFFCLAGGITIHRTNGMTSEVGPREIMFLSNCSGIASVDVKESLEGIFLDFNQLTAGDTLHEICRLIGNQTLTMKKLNEIMQTSGGYRIIPVSPWSRAVFYAMKRLPRNNLGNYCAMKTFELLYLICAQDTESDACVQQQCGNIQNVAASMKAYMEDHLEEKLTITEISHRFHMSRTACKSTFRSCYGQPIHSWLLDRRMEKAAELLENTKMPILQIAQSVGYTGVSQFNVAFRQRYGKSPREYRKMSVSVAF